MKLLCARGFSCCFAAHAEVKYFRPLAREKTSGTQGITVAFFVIKKGELMSPEIWLLTSAKTRERYDSLQKIKERASELESLSH